MKGMNPSIIFSLGLAVMAFIVLAIILSIGSTMMLSVQTTQYYNTIWNETINFAANKTWYPTTKTIISLSSVGNASIVIGGTYSTSVGIYNITYNTSHVNLTGMQGTDVGSYWVCYSYNEQYAYPAQATRNATAGLTNISTQLPLLGTILAFGTVILLLLTVFWFRSKSHF